VLPLPADADHYTVFGIPRQLRLDQQELSRRYYELSRLLHPDRHGTASAVARDASMRNTAALTRAHRTLRDPVSRALYWLELHGEKLGSDNRVPPPLAALVFEVQEKLEELREASAKSRPALTSEIENVLGELEARRDELDQRMEANFLKWDEAIAQPTPLLADLKSILAERAYLSTLIRDVKATLAGDTAVARPHATR